MSLRLILTRHAKSGWDDPSLSDHDRPLNERGRRSAPAIGRWLRDRTYLPKAALLSTARRVGETWDRLGLGRDVPEVTRDERLYLSEPAVMLERLSMQEAPSVILIAHNPGMASLARQLAEIPPEASGFDHFPTCATVVMDFDACNWSEVAPGRGHVVDFVTPRELMD